MKILHIIFILFFIILFILALHEIKADNLCDQQQCDILTCSLSLSEPKDKTLYILDRFCEGTVWPFAYIAASILSPLLLTTIPSYINVRYFITTFLIIFITFYCIMSFIIYHYIMPLKTYIIKALMINV